MRSTHTVAELSVSATAYDEIAAALRKAGYDHVFMSTARDGHPLIDLSGVAILRGAISNAPETFFEKLHALAFSPEEALQVISVLLQRVRNG